VLLKKSSAPPHDRSEKIASIPKSLALRMQWGRAAGDMEAIKTLSGVSKDTANM
jgi:hypothetical protein